MTSVKRRVVCSTLTGHDAGLLTKRRKQWWQPTSAGWQPATQQLHASPSSDQSHTEKKKPVSFRRFLILYNIARNMHISGTNDIFLEWILIRRICSVTTADDGFKSSPAFQTSVDLETSLGLCVAISGAGPTFISASHCFPPPLLYLCTTSLLLFNYIPCWIKLLGTSGRKCISPESEN